MTYLDLAPAITALRSRPEEFDFFNNRLHHRRSRHSFRFVGEDDVRIEAACDCAYLSAKLEQTRAFHAAYREWHASYWRPLQINREFASHFAPPPLWRRMAIGLLRWLVSRPSSDRPATNAAASPLQPVG